MNRPARILCLCVLLINCAAPSHAATVSSTDSRAPKQLRWRNATIKIALSTSLANPGSNFKLGSDVTTAVKRALARWSKLTNIKFVLVESTAQSVSPANAGDGVNLITIADTPINSAIFGGRGMTGRTRVFYDEETGTISEADIVINPHPVSVEGLPLQFSTDGSHGTYDLESTFTHEIGHLLGLDHSPVVAATMHPHQALNGLYGQKAFSGRTLSEDDLTRVRAIYQPDETAGVVEGRISRTLSPGASSMLPVWVEDSNSGRLIAGTFASIAGEYRFAELAPSTYRVVTSFASPERQEVSDRSEDRKFERELGAGEKITVNFSGPAANRFLNPRFVGMNGDLSTMPIPARAGNTLTIHLAGEGMDQMTIAGLSITSPYFKVVPGSLFRESFRTPFPVISFGVKIAANAPVGDYSIRLQSSLGEVAHLAGAITIDPGAESSFANPVDDATFFVRQHYQDFLGREPDPAGLDYWVAQLEQCGDNSECRRRQQLGISAAFLAENEFQRKASFIYHLYQAGLNRRPTFAEFSADRALVKDMQSEQNRLELVLDFVQRDEFRKLFPDEMDGKEFIESLFHGVMQTARVDLSVERRRLVAMYDGSVTGRAAILHRIASDNDLAKATRDEVFVLMQYFGYLLRDPEESDYRRRVTLLASRGPSDPSAYASASCGFLNSPEYQSRFSLRAAHTIGECK